MRRPKQQPVAKGKTKTRKQSSDARKRPKRPRIEIGEKEEEVQTDQGAGNDFNWF